MIEIASEYAKQDREADANRDEQKERGAAVNRVTSFRFSQFVS